MGRVEFGLGNPRKGEKMKGSTRVKLVLWLVIAILASFAVLATALSPADECELAGGVFDKVKGTQSCTFSDAPGNNQGGVVKETDVTQKGSSRSAHPEETEYCVNNNGGVHCPAGQQD